MFTWLHILYFVWAPFRLFGTNKGVGILYIYMVLYENYFTMPIFRLLRLFFKIDMIVGPDFEAGLQLGACIGAGIGFVTTAVGMRMNVAKANYQNEKTVTVNENPDGTKSTNLKEKTTFNSTKYGGFLEAERKQKGNVLKKPTKHGQK